MSLHKPRIGKRVPRPKGVGKRHAAKPKAVPQIKDKYLEDGTSYNWSEYMSTNAPDDRG